MKRYKWKGPVFEISALTREGCEPLIRAIYDHVAAISAPPVEDPDVRFEAPVEESPKPVQMTRALRAAKAKVVRATKAGKADKSAKAEKAEKIERDPRFDTSES